MEGRRVYEGPQRRYEDDLLCSRVKALEEKASIIDKRLERFEVALFSRGEDNEFGRPGILVTAERIDHHLDTMCRLAKAAKVVAAGAVSVTASVVAIGKTLNWF